MLTDAQIRKAKAADKPYKLIDGSGLHVYVTPAGGKLWRLRYEFERKEKLLSMGPCPSIGVAEARETATNAKRLLREGKDPAVEKRLRRLQIAVDGGTTFEIIAREWHDMNKGHWVEQHVYDVLNSLERDVFPDLGSAPIRISPQPTSYPCSAKSRTVRQLRPRGASGNGCPPYSFTRLHQVELRMTRRPPCRRQ
jgi:hypothetical protein